MNRRIEKEHEIGIEYLLPDYMGDVKKLLMSKARVIPADKLVSEGSVEVLGSVEYDLLYLDSEGKLTAVNTSSDFSETFLLDGEVYVDSNEESRVSALKVRVTGPRKISIKSDVRTTLSVSEENTLLADEKSIFEDGVRAEKRTAEVRYFSSIFEKSAWIEYAEVLETFDGALSMDGAEVMCVNAAPKVNEVKVSDGEISVKGENVVSAVIRPTEGTPLAIKKRFSFESEIPVEGARADMSAIVEAEASALSVSLSADGEQHSAIGNFTVRYNVELLENKTVQTVTDAYVPGCDSETEYADTEVCELLLAGTERLLVTVRCDKREERLDALSEVLCLSGEMRGVGCELSDAGGRYFGDIVVSGLGYETNVDGSITYVPFKIQGQFDEKANFDCQNKGKMTVEAIFKMEDCEAINEDESLAIRCSILVKYCVFSKKSVRTVTLCRRSQSQEASAETSRITVYYPKKGESLFDIAKRYKTTVKRIGEDNELTESALLSFDSHESVIGVKKLIIT